MLYLQEKQFEDFIASDKLSVIDFTAAWCGPCKQISPVFEQIAESTPSILCVKVDIDEEPDLANRCMVTSVPSFVFYRNGKEVHRINGANKSALTDYIMNEK